MAPRYRNRIGPRSLALGEMRVSEERSFAKVCLLLSFLGLWVGFAARPIRGAEAEAAAQANGDLLEPPLTDSDRDHWSFRVPTRPEPPESPDTVEIDHPIDRFVVARLRQAGLRMAPPAGPLTWLRRATYDLTGLPPTPAEIEAFTSDHDPAVRERVIDRLLSTPAYARRMARWWLDLARFAETDGFEFDAVRPDAWKYRDWVIASFQDDLPYDEFVRLQIAGDELKPGDADGAVATGFLLAGPDMPDLNLKEERRHGVLNDMTATVGAVFLALQIGCAQCHDHKFDPLSQADFYRLRACFESADLFAPKPFGRVVSEQTSPVGPSRMLIRGDFRRPGPEISPGVPRICDPWNTRIATPIGAASVGETASSGGQASGGRRSALAQWLTRPDHPLFARVIVNRIWQEHFGVGLVASASDFGVMGDAPTHPELLDWLATEAPRLGWRLKPLHRLIMTSATYSQASYLEPSSEGTVAPDRLASWRESLRLDPRDELLSRVPRRRLDGESLRDAMLAIGGQLNPRAGGPGVMAPLPAELTAQLLKDQWITNPDPAEHRRASVFLFARRNLRYPLFEVFDRPDSLASCARRNRSTTATQALTLLNSEFSWNCAREFASRVASEGGDSPSGRIEACYRLALSRPPTNHESSRAERFLRESGLAAEEALAEFCLALFNSNEFIHID